MSADLRDLYQEVILDHGKRPRNFRVLEGATHHADGFNPLCGDQVHLFVKLDGDVVSDLAFQGQGCAISQASASMMTQAIKGKSVDEARALFHRFHSLVTGEPSLESELGEPELGKLSAFAGVGEFPARVKCATLAWHTFASALENRTEPVSTE